MKPYFSMAHKRSEGKAYLNLDAYILEEAFINLAPTSRLHTIHIPINCSITNSFLKKKYTNVLKKNSNSLTIILFGN